MMAAGVPAGASRPYQASSVNPGFIASAMVGTSGNCALRFGPVTASARSLPALTCGSAICSAGKASWVWLVITEVTCSAALL